MTLRRSGNKLHYTPSSGGEIRYPDDSPGETTMPIAAKPTVPPQLVKVKAQGDKLISPLKAAVDALEVTSPEELTAADELLAGIRAARRQWKDIFTPVHKPLSEAKTAADKLNRQVDGPMEEMEGQVKNKIRDYRLQEAAENDRLERERQAAAAKVQQKLEETAAKEVSAKTPQLRQRLASQREQMETRAQELEEDKPEATKTTHSTMRKVKKWRLVNKEVAIKARPDLFELSTAAINESIKAYGGDPFEMIAGWPGFEVYEDIIIAGR